MRKALKIILAILIVAGIALLFFYWQAAKRNEMRQAPSEQKVSTTPNTGQISVNSGSQPGTSEPATTAANRAPAQDNTSNSPLPAKFLLQMPFYSQAPLGNWDATHEETCEESSVLNAGLYLLGKKLTPQAFDNELSNIIKIENNLFGDFKDTTVAQTKQFSDTYFAGKINSKIIDNPTIQDIETEIAAGHPVVVPLAGRDIGNPNFTPPGPIYHMLAIKGYDSQNFITNDVGTRKGDSYAYKKAVIMDNMHDWNEKDIHLGAKRVLVLFK